MREFILIGKGRNGKDVVICDRSVSHAEKTETYKRLIRDGSRDIESVVLGQIVPVKRAVRLSAPKEQPKPKTTTKQSTDE